MNLNPWKTIKDLQRRLDEANKVIATVSVDNRILRKQVAMFDHDGDGKAGGSTRRKTAKPTPG